MGSLPPVRTQRIAIIGAGPGGVAAAKCLLAENQFELIDLFEQQASFGGVWNYSNEPHGTIDIPQTNPNQPLEEPIWCHTRLHYNGAVDDEQKATFISPMYERLETNIPHVIMKHSDKLLEDNQLFPSRETILNYLEEYAQDIKHLVQFQTQVLDVRRISQEGQRTWLVQVKELKTCMVSEGIYDAVVVANGHYTVPYLPDIKGIREWNAAYPGVINHSKFYRRPDPYANKKVIIVGNSASGTDIATHVATVSKHPILMSQKSISPTFPFTASYKEDVAEITEFLPPAKATRAVRFKDGRVETDVEAILFATGYYYSFPFLSSLEPRVISTGERVENLYQHMFYIYDPSVAFIGIPSRVVPFRTFEGQAAVISRVWSHRLDLPSVKDMKKWEESRIAERGAGRAFHVLPFPTDFDYHNFLVDWASRAEEPARGRLPPRWNGRETWARERFPAIKKAFAGRGEARHEVKTMEELGFDYDVWRREQQRGENLIH